MTGDREIDRGENSTERLIPLSQTKEFKVARGDPNVTGWEVVSADGVKIGTVHDLIVDVPEMKVRYLDVNLDIRLVGREDDVVLPIGTAQLDDINDQVRLTRITSTDLKSLPPYYHNRITREHELALCRVLNRDVKFIPDADFYRHELFDDARFYAPRRRGHPLV